MSKAVDFDIVGSYNNQRVTVLDGERTVNLFQYVDTLAKKKKALLPTSGLINTALLFSGAIGGFRGQFVFNNITYSVIGNRVYSLSSSLTISLLGVINTNTGYVGIDANTSQVIFVDGQNGWIWNTTANTFQQITDTNFPVQPIDVCFLDGFFIVANGNTNTFQMSSLNQGLVWGEASATFTGSSATNELTVAGGTANFATGVDFQLSFSSPETVTFTANSATEELTLATASTNFATGAPVKVSTTGTLPSPLVAATPYYSINVNPTTIKLALTQADAFANIPINLTTNGTPTNSIEALGELPQPLNNTDTYFAIRTSPTTIRVADSYTNALSGIFITLTTDGYPTETITSLGQLQLGAITSHPGTIVACRTLHRRLFLFSQFFTEVWENAGIGTNLPVRRNNSLLMEYGTPAIGSIAVGFDKMFFLSQDRDGLGAVMEVIGSQSIPVSNRALDTQLSLYASNPSTQGVSDCRGFLIKENGLIFYRMNFTKSNHTFVYNVSLSNPADPAALFWHEEETLPGNRHPAQTHAYFNGVNYVGDYNSPILYILSSLAFTNNGEKIRRMRIWRPFVPPGYQRIRIDRFQLDLLQGSKEEIKLLPDLTPYVFLSISKDGGQTYGYTVKSPMGAVGQRKFRTLWRKLGAIPRGQAFVGKIEFFSPIPFIVLGAAWAMEILPE